MIRILDEFYQSADGIHSIHARWHIPEHPVALIRLCHGMCEYIERYDDFARFLAEHGFVVCGNDHLGHGASVSEGGQYGFFAEKNGMDFVLKDVHQLGKTAAERYPELPQVLFGHSMGSLIARRYLTEFSDPLAACILCGTLGPLAAPGLSSAIARIVSTLHGQKKVSKVLQFAAFGSYLKRIPNPVTVYDWVCTDETVVNHYSHDPLCTFRFTNSAMCDLIDLYGDVSKKEWANSLPKDLPILLIAGEEDPCGNYGKGVTEIFRRIRNAGNSKAALKLYPHVRHEILNDHSKSEVYADVLDFLYAAFHITEDDLHAISHS